MLYSCLNALALFILRVCRVFQLAGGTAHIDIDSAHISITQKDARYHVEFKHLAYAQATPYQSINQHILNSSRHASVRFPNESSTYRYGTDS